MQLHHLSHATWNQKMKIFRKHKDTQYWYVICILMLNHILCSHFISIFVKNDQVASYDESQMIIHDNQ